MKHPYAALSLALSVILPPTALAQGPDSEIAPNFILPDIDGVEHDMYAQLDQGKTVILEFWASWCEPCFESFPAMDAIWDAHGPQGDNTVMIYGLEMDNITWFEHEVRDDVGIQYPVFDNGHTLHPDWNLDGYPSYAIICPDRSWELVFGNIGNDPSYLMTHVNACGPASTILHDARPIDYVGELDLCQQDEFVPMIRIQNRGADLMTSAAIEVWANGALHYTFPWTGSLAQYYVSEPIVMPAIAGLGPSVDALFVITEVNGAADNFPGDNELVVSIGQSLPGIAVALEMQTDDVTWSVAYALYDDTGALIDTMDVPMDSHVVQNWTLEEGTCYHFVITDYLGDGMGNGGYYKLRDSQGVIFAQGTHFGFSAEHTFFVDGLSGMSEHAREPLILLPNPSDGLVTLRGSDLAEARYVEVFDVLGKAVQHSSVTADRATVDLSGLSDGVYEMRIRYQDGSWSAGRVVLDR